MKAEQIKALVKARMGYYLDMSRNGELSPVEKEKSFRSWLTLKTLLNDIEEQGSKSN